MSSNLLFADLILDVHGCIIELKLLLAKCGYQKGESTVVLVGDIVNGAPFSPEVIRFIISEGIRRRLVRGCAYFQGSCA